MRLSKYFLHTLKEDPRESEIISHKLMLRSGMITQMSSGIFAWLPLGLRVLNKISHIIREEQNKAGAIELLMPTLQNANLWKKSNRYDTYGKEMLRITDRHNCEMLYGPTNEEMITKIVADNIKSYKELPFNLYNIQWKFRDEIRPRFGVMRSREFLMKDAYSFDLTEEEGIKSFERMFISYLRIFNRIGLTAIPMNAPSGAIGGTISYEFIILAKTGESKIYCHSDYLKMTTPHENVYSNKNLTPIIKEWTTKYASTEDMHNSNEFNKISNNKKIIAKGIEVGQIFFFGTKYSKTINAYVQDINNKKIFLQSGSYGIGISRLLAAIIETYHDDNGIIWPKEIAPFHVGLINLKSNNKEAICTCEKIYKKLNKLNIETLYDDTLTQGSIKLKRMDLIGLPWQLIISSYSIENNLVELKNRKTNKKINISLNEAIIKLNNE